MNSKYPIILCVLALSTTALYPQTNEPNTLVIGELMSKVDPDRFEELLKSDYYPLMKNPAGITYNLVTNSGIEVPLDTETINKRHIKKLSFRFFNSESAMQSSLITEEIDFVKTESPLIADETNKANPAIKAIFKKKPDYYVRLVVYNNVHHLFRNRSIRRALTHAINKQYILNELLMGRANFAYGPLDKKSRLYIAEFEDYKYNPQKSIALLADEGYVDSNNDGILDKNAIPISFTLSYDKGVDLDEEIARMVKLDWNKIGIDVSIMPLTKKEINSTVSSRTFDAYLTGIRFDDTIENLEYYFKSSSEGNLFGYDNKTVSYFLYLSKRAKPSTRDQLLQGVVNTVIKDQPASFLFFPWLEWFLVNSNKFDNFTNDKKELLPFDQWKTKID